MTLLKTALILLFVTSCANRDDEFIWDRLSAAQQTAIQNAANLACTNASQSLINNLKLSSTAGLLALDADEYYTVSDGDESTSIVVIRQGTTADGGTDPNTVYIYIPEPDSSFKSIGEYPAVNTSKDVVYKITTTDNDSQWDVIQDAMCTNITSGTDIIQNSYVDVTSGFNYTLKLEDGTGNGQEADIDTYNFRTLSNYDLPAFFQFFNIVYSSTERAEDGSTEPEEAITHTLTFTSGDYTEDIETTAFKNKIIAAEKCEYTSISTYSSTDNKGIVVPTTCSTTQYDIKGFTIP